MTESIDGMIIPGQEPVWKVDHMNFEQGQLRGTLKAQVSPDTTEYHIDTVLALVQVHARDTERILEAYSMHDRDPDAELKSISLAHPIELNSDLKFKTRSAATGKKVTRTSQHGFVTYLPSKLSEGTILEQDFLRAYFLGPHLNGRAAEARDVSIHIESARLSPVMETIYKHDDDGKRVPDREIPLVRHNVSFYSLIAKVIEKQQNPQYTENIGCLHSVR